MRKAIKSILLTLVLSVALLLVLIFDLSPVVENTGNSQVDNAESVQPLLNQLRQTLRKRYSAQTLVVNAKQTQSMSGFLQRATNKASSSTRFSQDELQIVLSYKISTWIRDFYVNIQVAVTSGKGVNIASFRIGQLSLPGNFVLESAEYAANTYTQSNVATKAIATVDALKISPQDINISLKPMDTLLREFKNIKTGGGGKEHRLLKIRIAHYLRFLDQLYTPLASLHPNGPSLAYQLHALMKEAQSMSESSSATLENEAALLAIAIYAGSPRFATFVGDLSFAIERIPYAQPKPVLKKRSDLSLHFVFSAALKLMSEKGVSIAVGEFKELMDRGTGGSGYSFIDLAADLSGAHFAALAVDPRTAKHLQSVMVLAPDEALFMADIAGLEEGMSKAAFEAKYDKVDSPAYLQVVDLINQRIAQLPISKDMK